VAIVIGIFFYNVSSFTGCILTNLKINRDIWTIFPEFCYALYIFICFTCGWMPKLSSNSRIDLTSELQTKNLDDWALPSFLSEDRLLTLPGISIAVWHISKLNFLHMRCSLKAMVKTKLLMALPLQSDTTFAFQNNSRW
jgi:hypothetical protein